MTAAGTEPKLLLISPISATNYKISAGWTDYPLLGTIHPALAQIFYLTIFSSAQIHDINKIFISHESFADLSSSVVFIRRGRSDLSQCIVVNFIWWRAALCDALLKVVSW